MKNSMTFEEKTEQIVEALFYGFSSENPKAAAFRCLDLKAKPEEVQSHGVGSAASTFNPGDIAKTLRDIGDQYNADLEGAVQMVIVEKSKKKLKKFREMAESLSKTWSRQNPELEYEKAFLAVAVKLFGSLVQRAPDMFQEPELLTQAINENPEVRGYIERQGGWENLGNRRGQNNP